MTIHRRLASQRLLIAMLLNSPKADDGTRTRYLELGKLALYQVSYVREGGHLRSNRPSL